MKRRAALKRRAADRADRAWWRRVHAVVLELAKRVNPKALVPSRVTFLDDVVATEMHPLVNVLRDDVIPIGKASIQFSNFVRRFLFVFAPVVHLPLVLFLDAFDGSLQFSLALLGNQRLQDTLC